MLKILYSAYPKPEPRPNNILAKSRLFKFPGYKPTTKHVPNKVIKRAIILMRVKGSLNKKKEIIVTKVGPVYNRAVAIGIVDNSMAVNIQ